MRAFRGPTSSWAARAGSSRPTASAMARSLAPPLRLGLFARPEREREKRGAGARACARARSSRVKVAAGSGATGGGFETLGLRTDLAARLRDLGVFKPTPIQSAAIPTLSLSAAPSYAIESYTGSGKTLAYLLPAATPDCLLISRPKRQATSGRQWAHGCAWRRYCPSPARRRSAPNDCMSPTCRRVSETLCMTLAAG